MKIEQDNRYNSDNIPSGLCEWFSFGDNTVQQKQSENEKKMLKHIYKMRLLEYTNKDGVICYI